MENITKQFIREKLEKEFNDCIECMNLCNAYEERYAFRQMCFEVIEIMLNVFEVISIDEWGEKYKYMDKEFKKLISL